MEIKKNSVVSVYYTLTVPINENADKEIVEQTNPDHPFQFVFGAGLMLDAFENALLGKKPGDQFDIFIQCADAYQEPEDDLIIQVPRSIFADKEGVLPAEIIENSIVNLEDEDGNVVPAIVLSINDTHIEVDTNHPLAGYDLCFVGHVDAVREASSEELENPESLMDLPFNEEDEE
jgi:FKBP-type peptidyl-prolyl cis-trans isomerase SlyD